MGDAAPGPTSVLAHGPRPTIGADVHAFGPVVALGKAGRNGPLPAKIIGFLHADTPGRVNLMVFAEDSARVEAHFDARGAAAPATADPDREWVWAWPTK